MSYFDRLKETLDGLERCVFDDERYWGYSVAIMDLKYEALVADISLDYEESAYVREKALEHLEMGTKGEFLSICCILPYTGSCGTESIESSLTHHLDYKEGQANQYEIAISLLSDASVFESGEILRYYDVGMVGFQKKDVGMSGLIILTDRRIIVIGGYANLGMSSKRHKLFYGDLREPYLSTVDFIRLDTVKDIELKKNEIKMKYDTEYIVEKDRTFYGPYFFKFELPTSINVKSGTVKISITLAGMSKEIPIIRSDGYIHMNQAITMWNNVEVPHNYDQARLKTFYARLTG